jgi:PAS domain S-box-containing protein
VDTIYFYTIGSYTIGSYTLHIWLPFLTALFLIALSAYSWRHRSVPGALPFAIGSLFAALWVAGSLMEYAATDAGAKIFWIKFQAASQLPAVTAIMCFVLEYSWPGRWLTRRNLALLFIAPLLALVLVLTNELHRLIWSSFALDSSDIPLLGPGARILLAYAYGLGLVELLVFAWLLLHSRQNRWPVVIMLAGLVGARTVYLLEVTALLRSALPLDVLLIAYLFLMYAIALFGFHILDPLPLARQMVIAQMRGGVLVLDPQGRVASVNPAAEEMLGAPARQILGRPVQELLPASAALLADLQTTRAGSTEIRQGVEPSARAYSLESSPLRDWRGLEVGRLLLLHDITIQKQAQAQLIEQQRALAMLHERDRLARELHDSLGQIFAFVNAQGQAVRRLLSRGDITTADAYVGRLVEVAREADVDIRESILGLRVALSQPGLFAALTHYLAQYEKNYGIHIKLDKPETFTDGAFEPLVEVQLLRIVQEALTNVRKHADAHCVRIAFARADGEARVTVHDDGEGFDPAGVEERCGEHIGLRVMRERAEEVGGSVSLHSAPGQGTKVVVRVPARWATRTLCKEGTGYA